MREIKFRGLTKDGKWVYGCYCEIGNIGCIVIENTPPPVLGKNAFTMAGRGVVFIEVDPKTVSQSTGLKDKNGKAIWEGDIVEMNPVDDEWTDVVVWWAKEARFELKSFVNQPNNVTMCRLAKDAAVHKDNDNPCIVIGSIHQNPELLEIK